MRLCTSFICDEYSLGFPARSRARLLSHEPDSRLKLASNLARAFDVSNVKVWFQLVIAS